MMDLDDVPLYNGDVEAAGNPVAVTALRAAVSGADALLIATPEYNHGVPGVLKNAVDWLSRPPRGSVLDAFVFTNSYAMPQPEILVARAQTSSTTRAG